MSGHLTIGQALGNKKNCLIDCGPRSKFHLCVGVIAILHSEFLKDTTENSETETKEQKHKHLHKHKGNGTKT